MHFSSRIGVRDRDSALGYRIHALFISNRCTRSGQRVLGSWVHALSYRTGVPNRYSVRLVHETVQQSFRQAPRELSTGVMYQKTLMRNTK